MKKAMIGFLILSLFTCVMAQKKRISTELFVGQNVQDGHKPMVVGLNLNLPLTNHFFLQTGYNFAPDYQKQFNDYVQSHGSFFKLYGGYDLGLWRKTHLRLKAGISTYNIQFFGKSNWHQGFYVGEDQVGMDFAFGASLKHLTSGNMSFIWGFEAVLKLANVVVFAGFSLDL